MSDYVIWSNEHSLWWAADERGYDSSLNNAGRYTREKALGICTGARGGRRFNANPSEVPLLYVDAVAFWQDDKPEWREERARFADEERRQKYRDLALSEEDIA